MIMRKFIFIMALALVSVMSADAQDRIYFNDSRIVDVVVDEVSDNYIYYRLYGNQEGPVCSTSTYNVFKIVYYNGEEQFFTGGTYYDGRLLDESMRGLLGGQPMRMRFDSGKLYLGSRSHYGAMQADYIAFNLYGDEYHKARNNRLAGYIFVGIGSFLVSAGFAMVPMDMSYGGAVTALVGAGCLGAGIPLVCKGNKRLKAIANDYNANYADGRSTELTFGPCPSGVGFALKF